MDNQIQIKSSQNPFEDSKKIDENGMEYWEARQFMKLLEYKDWRNASNVILKAMTACRIAGKNVEDHFVEFTNLVEIGSGALYKASDYKLTRYACYLVAQNGDSSKEPIALAQNYFAEQTRKQELYGEGVKEVERIVAREKLTKTEVEFAKTIYERGVDGKGIGEIRNAGDYFLFDGNNTKQMKEKLGVKDSKPLADFLPTVTIKAKDLATEMTTFNAKRNDLKGVPPIREEHVKNNKAVRKVLTDSGIFPENLPPEEDIKKVERKYKNQLKIDMKPAEALHRIAQVKPPKAEDDV